MAQVLDTRADGSTILGGGRRATTLRARVRGARKYLGWLAVAHGRVFPSEPAHLTGFLEARHSDPCNRGSLKAAHQSFVFLESVAGVEEKMATGALYGAVCKELLATAQPGRAQKQAPRYPVVVVESLEVLVIDDGALFFFRKNAWWLLLSVLGHVEVRRSPRTASHDGLFSQWELAGCTTYPLEDDRAGQGAHSSNSGCLRSVLREETGPVVQRLGAASVTSELSEGLLASHAFVKFQGVPTTRTPVPQSARTPGSCFGEPHHKRRETLRPSHWDLLVSTLWEELSS